MRPAWLIPFLLAACMPVGVVPPHGTLLRANIAPEVPAWLETGRTTRAEAVLRLGEPDGVGEGEAWFAWTGAEARGGALFIVYQGPLFSTEAVTYRRLLVRFDAAGLARDAAVTTRTCVEQNPGASLVLDMSWQGPCVGLAWVRGGE